MKKTISIIMVALLLMTTLVSAVSFEDKEKSVTSQESSATIFKWYWNLLKDYTKVIRENRELRAEIQELKDNPIIEKVYRTSTRTITNTEYIVCEECNPSPYCPPPKHLVWDNIDQCGCKVNVRCINEVSIKPIARIK